MRRRVALLLATMLAALLLAGGVVLAQSGGDTGEVAGTADRADAALDRALKELVVMRGGPPGVIAIVQRDRSPKIHTFGVANLKTERRMGSEDRMRIASAAKAFSGAVALSLVSEGALSLWTTPSASASRACRSRPPLAGRISP